jgi:hypothetical protein
LLLVQVDHLHVVEGGQLDVPLRFLQGDARRQLELLKGLEAEKVQMEVVEEEFVTLL